MRPWVPRTQALSAPTAPPAANPLLPFFMPLLPATALSLWDAPVSPPARGILQPQLGRVTSCLSRGTWCRGTGLLRGPGALPLTGGQIPME